MVIVEGVAHRADCDRVPRKLLNESDLDSCGRGLPRRAPPAGVRKLPAAFETLLGHQLEHSLEALVHGPDDPFMRGAAWPLIRRSVDQPDVTDGVCELRPPRVLEVRRQVELAGVVVAVARSPAARHDTERVIAPAERPRGEPPAAGVATDKNSHTG